MQPNGVCSYIFDDVSNSWVPWEGTVAGFGGVTLFTPGGQAIDTPTGDEDNFNTAHILGVASFTYGYNSVSGNWDRIQGFTNAVDAFPQDGGSADNLSVLGMNYGFNGVSFDRIRSFAGDADALAAPTLGLLGQKSFPVGFNGATYDRIRSFAANADNVTAPTLGLLGCGSFAFLFDGTNFDRARSLVDNADDIAVGTVGLAGVVARLTAFDGTTYDRVTTGSAANLSAAQAPAPLLVTNPGTWAIAHAPAANTQATISRAAGAAGVRHVCKSITGSVLGLAAAAETTVSLRLRDGATGAGTILWEQTVLVAVSQQNGFALTDLNIFGSAATAMTLEFSAAGGANTTESVALSGYDAI